MLERKAEKQYEFRKFPAGKGTNRSWILSGQIMSDNKRMKTKLPIWLCKCVKTTQSVRERGWVLVQALTLLQSWGDLIFLDSCENILVKNRAFKKLFFTFQNNRSDKGNLLPQISFLPTWNNQFDWNDRKMLVENVVTSKCLRTTLCLTLLGNFFFFNYYGCSRNLLSAWPHSLSILNSF